MDRILTLNTGRHVAMCIIVMGGLASFEYGLIDYLIEHQSPAFLQFSLGSLSITAIVFLATLFSKKRGWMASMVRFSKSHLNAFFRDGIVSSNAFRRTSHSTSSQSSCLTGPIPNRSSQDPYIRSMTQPGCDLHADVLSMLPYGVAYADKSGRIIVHNHTFIHMLILERVPLTTLDVLFDAIQPFLSESDRHEVEASWLGDSQLSFVLEVRCGETLQYIQMTRQPAAIQQNETGILITSRDITRQKLSDSSRDHFLSTATHELRTPLANIIAYAETLTVNDSIDLDQQKHFCNVIRSEAMRLSRFVDELLDINRMEAGSLSLRRSEAEMLSFLMDVCEKIRPLMTSRQLDFTCRFPSVLPTLQIDRDKLTSALINLLGNAAKYTPAGGHVEFRAVSLEHCVCLEVQDTGIGIAKDELPRIFEKLFRSDDDRVQEITGSGLGLSFTREVVKLHDGDLSVQSEIGKGSTFIMTLPRW